MSWIFCEPIASFVHRGWRVHGSLSGTLDPRRRPTFPGLRSLALRDWAFCLAPGFSHCSIGCEHVARDERGTLERCDTGEQAKHGGGVTEVPTGVATDQSRYFMVSSDKLSVLLCAGTALIDAMVHSKLPQLLSSCTSLVGLTTAQQSDVIGSIHMALYKSVYLTLLNAVSGDVLAQRASAANANVRVVRPTDGKSLVSVLETQAPDCRSATE